VVSRLGLGLESWQPGFSFLEAAFWLIFIGYIAGRLVEGIFKKFLEPSASSAGARSIPISA